MRIALLPFTLLLVPLLEIAVFILVGGAIGLWPTLGLVLLTAILGSILLRRQGISTLTRIQRQVAEGRVPGEDLVSGVMIAVAGVLLLTPGFVTDSLGFLLFVPGVRSRIFRFLRERAVVVASSGMRRPGPEGADPRPRRPDVVDLSNQEFHRRADPTSPWHDNGGEPPNRTLH